ncbi:MAG TPA: hypothetical protein VNZ52_00875 [Candidatus Thermoplasmatota archaeon]|nr:hypothetical protein [Candidatus Thermoplasmatota archaeon]
MAEYTSTYWLLVAACGVSAAALVGLLLYLRRTHAPVPLVPFQPPAAAAPTTPPATGPDTPKEG